MAPESVFRATLQTPLRRYERTYHNESAIKMAQLLETRPALTSHAGMRADERHAIGIADALIRLPVGLESTDDMIADLGSGPSVAIMPKRMKKHRLEKAFSTP